MNGPTPLSGRSDAKGKRLETASDFALPEQLLSPEEVISLGRPKTQSRIPTRNPGQSFVLVSCIAGLFALLIQSRSVWNLRRENDRLRTELRERRPPPPRPPQSSEALLEQQLGRARIEVLQLNNQVQQLREQLAAARMDRQQPPHSPAPTNHHPSQLQTDDTVRQLGVSASAGDSTAIDDLAELSSAARATLNTNQMAEVFTQIRRAFEVLGTEAGKGNLNAQQGIWKALQTDSLQGFAVEALGAAAGQGDEAALQLLLEPEKYSIARPGAVTALKAAADNGNSRAIEALAVVAGDSKSQVLWPLAADALQKAAGAGNAEAIEALGLLLKSDNENVRQRAMAGLNLAASNQNSRALDLLRNSGN